MTAFTFRPLAALLALLLITVTACTDLGAPQTVSVLGPWTGEEEAAFRRMVAPYEREFSVTVNYQGTSAVAEVLRAKVQDGSPPDVAVLWSPNELAEYVRTGHLRPLNTVVDERTRSLYREHWLLPQRHDGGHTSVYAIPIKANLKSMIWYRRGPSGQPGPWGRQAGQSFADRPPATWADLIERSRDLAGEGPPWCLALNDNPAAGWPGTDWIENILLHRYPEAYSRWVAGELPWTSREMREVWRSWGEIVTRADTLVHGGTTAALLSGVLDAGRSLSRTPPDCLLQHAPSFAMDNFRAEETPDGSRLTAGEDFDFFPFPRFGDAGDDSAGRPANVSADLAGMFQDTPQARELMRFLASPRAQRIWPSLADSSAFSLNTQVASAAQGNTVRAKISGILGEPANTLCFDASDAFPTTMRNAFNRAVLEYVSPPHRLEELLGELERVRTSISKEDWLTEACTEGGRR